RRPLGDRAAGVALDWEKGLTPNPDNECHACRAIAEGTSLDVVETDAASQRRIDDIRSTRGRGGLQPSHGRYYVYILDDAKQATVQAVLQLLGAVEEEALFRLCDLIVDRDTAGALTFIEEPSEQGQDLGRLVTELLEHLRHLLLVQHMGEVPESLPVTEETRDRLREQANQLPEPTVLRLCDLL